jgi:hypothetical protein
MIAHQSSKLETNEMAAPAIARSIVSGSIHAANGIYGRNITARQSMK